MDAAGNLSARRHKAARRNLGTLYDFAPDGTFTLLHQFQRRSRWRDAPTAAPLTLDARGTIGGLTVQGGTANGPRLWLREAARSKCCVPSAWTMTVTGRVRPAAPA